MWGRTGKRYGPGVQVRDDGGLARRWGAGKKADGFRIPALTLTSTDQQFEHEQVIDLSHLILSSFIKNVTFRVELNSHFSLENH